MIPGNSQNYLIFLSRCVSIMFASLCLTLPAKTVFVDAEVPASGDGLAWTDAKKSIPEAIDIALPGDEIWVAEGIYTDSIELTTGVAVYGGFDKSESNTSERNLEQHSSIIDFAVSTSSVSETFVVSMINVINSRLDGFTLNGKADAPFAALLICNSQDDSCVIANCTISGEGYDRGISIREASPTIINCRISGFSEDGIFSTSEDSPQILNCIISNNGDHGINIDGPFTMKNCTIINNRGERTGIGVSAWGAANIENCLMSGNLIGIQMSGDGAIENCRIVGNNGIGLANRGIDPDTSVFLKSTVKNCIITGNGSYGVKDVRSNSTYINCTISDNQESGLVAAPQRPDVFLFTDHGPTLTNCIISNNNDYGIKEELRENKVKTQNCLFFDNAIAEYRTGLGQSLTDVQELIENLDERTTEPLVEDPLFTMDIPQSWSAVPTVVVEEGATRTLLTNALANYSPDELAGSFINPNIEQNKQALILSNTDTTIKVNGDFRELVQNGDEYVLIDYRLRPGSPAIDAGSGAIDNLSSDVDGFPRPVDIVDSGAEATGTEYDIGAFEFGALQAWIRDYILATNMFESPADPLATFDTNDDGVINIADILFSFRELAVTNYNYSLAGNFQQTRLRQRVNYQF